MTNIYIIFTIHWPNTVVYVIREYTANNHKKKNAWEFPHIQLEVPTDT